MAKIRHLSEIQQEIAFTEFDFYQRYAETFLKVRFLAKPKRASSLWSYGLTKSFKTSELGRIKSLLPLREMAISFNLVEERPMHKRVKPQFRNCFNKSLVGLKIVIMMSWGFI